MKKLSLVVVAFFVVAQNAFSQCAMCKVVAEQGSSNELEFGHNINYGIVFFDGDSLHHHFLVVSQANRCLIQRIAP